MKKIVLLTAAAALIASPAFADVAAQLSVAQTHAGMAAKQTDIKAVQMHLHHAVNCLVGPAGPGFDAAAGNPCAKAGSGAIPETTDAAQKAKLEAALAKAKPGLATTDLAAAQKAAQDTADAVAAAK
ncbi:MAG: hypothetical protein BGN82_07890 [Alphaproteobacteria bacterium 65-7]|nr:MAG: hypothetical protein BGN82_07890 [Alphaproteobacteria bacterium 65-7]